MMKAYLVGGAVRDTLLNLPVRERDWVVLEETPEAMLQKGFTEVGKDFPVFLHPKTKDEYALARTERKTTHGYKGFAVYATPDVSLEEDLLRRDLTINAMAMLDNGEIIDPYGGQEDLKNRVFRHISPAFCEDPVRVLRIARFCARYQHLGFHIAPETQKLMQDMVTQGEINHLVPDRVWAETAKALSEQSPSAYFQALRDCGALARIFPEIDALFGVPQTAVYHPEIDTGIHTLMVLDQAVLLSDKTTVRFAALTHDLGKALTPRANWPSHHGHETLGLAPITQLCARLKIPNNYKELAALVSEFHTHIHKAFELTEKTILKVFKRCDAFRRPGRFHDLLLCCEADSKGRYGFEENAYPQADFFKEALSSANAVTVEDLISQGFKGKQLGIQIDLHRCNNIKAFALSYPS